MRFLFSDRNLKGAALPCALAGVALLIYACLAGPNGYRHYSALAGGIVLGFSLALIVACFGSAGGSIRHPVSSRETGLVVAYAILLGLIAYFYGMHQFGGFDQSLIVDVGWRLINGQRPYVDFPCTLPIDFYMGAELAFRLFGVYWRSNIILNSIWTCLCFIWLHGLLRCILQSRLLAFCCAMACVAMTTVALSFWWYNSVTSVSNVLYACSVVAVLLAPRSSARWLSLCASLLLVALSKPNTATPLIFGGTIALIFCRPTRLPAIAASLVAFGLWLAIIRIHGSTVQQVIAGYLSVASRGMTMQQFRTRILWPEKLLSEIALEFTMVLLVIMPWLYRSIWRCARRGDGSAVSRVFLLFCFIAGVYGYLTNNDLKFVDLPILLVGGILLLSGPGENPLHLALPGDWNRYFLLLCIWFSCIGFSEGAVRNRIKGIADFFDFTVDPRPFNVPFFDGLRAGPSLHHVVDDIAAVVSSGDTSSIYFGNDLQWAYPAFHIPSPTGQPIFWVKGVAFAAADEPRLIQDWLSRRFNPVLLMTARYYDDAFRQAIGEHYGLQSERYFPKKPGCPPFQILVPRNPANRALQEWVPDD